MWWLYRIIYIFLKILLEFAHYWEDVNDMQNAGVIGDDLIVLLVALDSI